MAAGVSIVVCLLLQITCFSTLLDGTETFEGNDYVLYTLIYIYIVCEIVLVVVVILQVTVLVAVVAVSIRNLKCVPLSVDCHSLTVLVTVSLHADCTVCSECLSPCPCD